jgi:hypothetical protein
MAEGTRRKGRESASLVQTFWRTFGPKIRMESCCPRIRTFGLHPDMFWALADKALKPISPKQPSHKSDKSALRSCCALFRIFAYLDSMGRKRKAAEIDSSTASRSSKTRLGTLARKRPWGNSDNSSVLADIDSELFRVLTDKIRK